MPMLYSKSFYTSSQLKHWATKYLRRLPRGIGGLLCTGRSGTAIASAMMARSSRRLECVVAKKPGDNEHSFSHHGQANPSLNYAIVDDFINTGATVERLLTVARMAEIKVTAILVGYNKSESEFDCPIITIQEG